MPRKFKIFFLVLILLLPVFSFKTEAQGTYRVVIEDEEDLLTESEESLLKAKMQPITAYGNVAFVTVSQYSETDTYAKKKYRELFGTESGILFLIDMGRRNIWIFSDGAVYRVINKAYANTITDNVYRKASRGDYYGCASDVFEQALILLEGGKIAQPMKYISNALINFVVLTLQRSKGGSEGNTGEPAMAANAGIRVLSKKMLKRKVSRHVESSSGGGGGGGSSGGGGGGGGGSSGGGGGHSF